MPKIEYVSKRFGASAMDLIDKANAIIEEYQADGFDLTLRQLYYQFVSKDFLPNNEQSYDRLGATINDARLAGLVDWEAITDRMRTIEELSHFDDPADIVRSAANWFTVARWAGQKKRVEVWIEKDALVGTIRNVCTAYDCPYLACRGYTSASSMWQAAQRFKSYHENGQCPVIIHLGDHDPSGIDMTRDIRERMQTFLDVDTDLECKLELQRVALNMAQVRRYNPPPNPAKMSDARAKDYVAKFGRQSWELDALSPRTIEDLVRKTIRFHIDDADAWNEQTRKQSRGRLEIKKAGDQWSEVAGMLDIDEDEIDGDEE